jgi:p21-activated kinase 1
MRLSPQKETYDSYTPSGPSSRTSISRVLYHEPSKETIQSHQGSISNSSFHTATASIDKDPLDLSGQSSFPPVSYHFLDSTGGRDPPISDHKSFHSHQKQTFGLRNQSLSTVCTTRELESYRSSTATSTPKEKFRSLGLSLPSLKDEAVSSLPSTPRPSRAIALTVITDLISRPVPSPVYAVSPSPPSDDGDSLSLATVKISTPDTPSIRSASFLSRPIDRMGTISRSRSGTVPSKGKKGMLGFMTDFLNSNKRPEITTPHDLVHVTHVRFNSSTGKFTGLPTEWQQPLQDSGISESDQEKNPLAVMEIVKFYQEGGGDIWDRTGHSPAPGSSQSPPILGGAHVTYPGVSKTVDDSFVPTVSVSLWSSLQPLSDGPNQMAFSVPKNSHFSDDPQSASPSHLPASYRAVPSPPLSAHPNVDRSNSQQSVPKSPQSDTLIRANTTKDRRYLAPSAAVEAPVRESPSSWIANPISNSQATVVANSQVAERQVSQHPTPPRQPNTTVTGLAKAGGATPRRREKMKEDNANDADTVKHLQQILMDADPTRLYRNLVKTGQG